MPRVGERTGSADDSTGHDHLDRGGDDFGTHSGAGADSCNTRADVPTRTPTQVTRTSERLGALVTPNGVAVPVSLKMTTKRSTHTMMSCAVSGPAPLATLRMTVTGLKPGTQYTARAIAVNGGKKTFPGTTMSLTTKR